jgi:tetratricopeptide (TPR) repeat protein
MIPEFELIDLSLFAKEALRNIHFDETENKFILNLLERSIEAWDENNLINALKFSDDLTIVAPEMPLGIILNATLLLEHKEYDRSLSLLLKQDISDWDSKMLFYYNLILSCLFFKKSNYRETIKYVSRAIEIDKKLYLAYYIRAIANASLGIHLLAIPDYKISLKAKYKTNEIKANLAYSYLRNGNDFMALILYRKLWRIFPNNYNVIYNTALAYLRFRRYKMALYFLDKSINLNIDFNGSYLTRGYIRFKLKNKIGAIEDLIIAQNMGSDKATVLLNKLLNK